MPDASAIATGLLVGAPALAAVGIARVGVGSKVAALLVGGSSTLSAALSVALLFLSPRGVAHLWDWSPALLVDLSWRIETAPLALAVLIASIGALVLQYAGSYFDGAPNSHRTLALLGAFESSMLGLVLADNLLLMYVFWELTGLCSFFLIGSDRAKGESGLRAARQALLVTVAGGLSMLVGVVYLASVGGSTSLTALAASGLTPRETSIALALILPAVLTKSAQFPTHFWLPGAMAAPTPVSAYLHSATMVKAGIVLLLYLYPILGRSPLWTGVLLPIGAITCIWGSLRALGERDIKLLLAWSTVSQLGLLTLTIGLGTDVAIRAAVLHLFAHAIFKAGLFLVVGGVDHSAHTRLLPELGGLRRRLPLLAVLAAILCGSMAGVPPLAGFLSKELIVKKAMLTELWVHVVAIGAIVFGSIGTVAYSSRLFFEVFTGAPRSPRARKAEPVPMGFLAAPLLLATVTLLAGPAARWVDLWFLEPVAISIVGRVLEVKPLSLWYGINAALLVSVGIVSTGYLADRLLGLRFLGPDIPRKWRGAELFDSALAGSQACGSFVAKGLAAAEPRVYLMVAVGLGFLPGLGLVPMFWGAPRLAAPSWTGWILIAVLAALLMALMASRRRMPRILLLTAIGFAVAVVYRLMNGPDLMLTQLLVEVLVTIFLALALGAMPVARRPPPGTRQWGREGVRILLACGAAISAAALVPALYRLPQADHVATFVRNEAPEIAKGKNLVNVVLTDVRALDTLLETVVVVIASLGVVALLRGNELGPREPVDRLGNAPVLTVRSGLLPALVGAISAIGLIYGLTLLIKGHNDPGGGFVAGLSLGVVVMLVMVGMGRRRLHWAGRRGLATWSTLGAVLMLVLGTAGLVLGDGFLTQYHGSLSVLTTAIALHSALIFDLGVVLAVAGGTGAAGLALWSMRNAPAGRGDGV